MRFLKTFTLLILLTALIPSCTPDNREDSATCYDGDMSIREFFLGQQSSDVQLDPRLAGVEEQRRGLQALLQAEATGQAITPGEQAASLAGQRAAEAASARQMSMAAGARGFGRVAAQSEAAGRAAQLEQGIAGQTVQQAMQARMAGTQAARSGLMAMSEAELRQILLEQQLREEQRKKGILGTVGALGGAAIGGLAGGAKGAQAGAQIGGLAGSGIGQQFA